MIVFEISGGHVPNKAAAPRFLTSGTGLRTARMSAYPPLIKPTPAAEFPRQARGSPSCASRQPARVEAPRIEAVPGYFRIA
jgi:hypothetical protein